LTNRSLVYNAWHKTELERWLDDHDIPYPAAADRKDLIDFVSKNWDKVSTAVYETWDDARLKAWLQTRSLALDTEAKKQTLLDQVKANWYGIKVETETSWETVKDWIFDS
jgi:Putative nuclear envelope organisation protein